MLENNVFDLKLFLYFSGCWCCCCWCGKSDNIANSVQLLLQLPTGTELGNYEYLNNFVQIYQSKQDLLLAQAACVRHACLRVPHEVADEAKLAIVFTYFFLFFFAKLSSSRQLQ